MAEANNHTRSSVAAKCSKIYEDILNLVNYCQNEPDENIIKECIIYCDMNIDLLDALYNVVAKTGKQKQYCFFTTNLIRSLKDTLVSMLIKEGGGDGVEYQHVKRIESNSAFDGAIRTGIIKNVNHIDPIKFFEDSKDIFVSEIRKTFKQMTIKSVWIFGAYFCLRER